MDQGISGVARPHFGFKLRYMYYCLLLSAKVCYHCLLFYEQLLICLDDHPPYMGLSIVLAILKLYVSSIQHVWEQVQLAVPGRATEVGFHVRRLT